MSNRVISISLFVLSLIAIPVGYFFIHPELFNWCQSDQFGCISQQISFGIGKPLFWSTRWLPVLFFFLIFVRKEVFTTWWKTILWFAVPALLLIVSSPSLPAFLTPDRTEMTDLMVKLIVIISLIIIAWKYWRLNRAEKSRAA